MAPDGRVYFTDIPDRTIHIYDPGTGETSIFTENSGGTNGLWFQGNRLWACEDRIRRRLVSYELDHDGGEPVYHVHADRFNGGRLNSPNDLAVDPDSGVYFTDPRYGNRNNLEQPVEGVYYQPAEGDLMRVLDNLARPNGIGLSPDGTTLYVADHGAGQILAYAITAPGVLEPQPVFYALPGRQNGPDGIWVDTLGRVYITVPSQQRLVIVDDQGQPIGRVHLPENPTNVTMNADESTLYVTAGRSLYRVDVQWPEAPSED